MNEIVALDALSLSRRIRAREVSCREVMRAYLDRIARLNPLLNAIVSLEPEESLLAQADACDAMLSRGQWLGWMHGMPQAPKDLAQTRGMRTTWGSPIFRDFVPDQDAAIVERVRSAGAILVGKTNVPEFGLGSQTFNEVFGPTRNPWDPSRTAGGSSGGAAAALAARMLPVADGSDMMGSLRNPAAFCNVYGFRPSRGRVPNTLAPDAFSQQLSTDGPMGRSVADVAMLLATQAGYDARAPLSLDNDPAVYAQPLERDFAGARIGWLGDLGGHLPFEPGVLELCRDALKAFETIGCTVDEARVDFDPARMWQTWLTWRRFLVSGSLAVHYRDPQRRALLKPEAVWEIEQGLGTAAIDVHDASVARTALYRAVLAAFERFDFLVLPTAQVFPFDVNQRWPRQIAGREMDTYHRWMEVVILPTLTGCPALSVPAGFGASGDSAGLPMGIQIVGRPRDDLSVLQLGHAWERATEWGRREPAGLREVA
ncbi:amidase [Burkholderiaceae bacterium FT117]|uniref:amidase n=1 Tax=Zeimonas sediminis TaxID=2944268 RepID=UPI0023431455|nr:amidase [Zeimonas sediminis]MCM5571443.1 amidase [Zeimonas sediminis]